MSIEDRLTELEASNVRRVLHEGIINAQLREIATAILELSQFNRVLVSDEPGLTLRSHANMQSIQRAPNFEVTEK